MTTSHAPRPSFANSLFLRKLGGPTAIAAYINEKLKTKVSPQAVSNWHRRGIPFAYRATLALWAGERGIGAPPGFMGEPGVTPETEGDDIPGFLRGGA